MSVKVADHPCWTIECDRCGEGDNSEYGGCFHHATLAEAEQAVRDIDWMQALDGSWLCSSCWDDAVAELPCPHGARCSAISCCQGDNGPKPLTAGDA
jgi:hypothetical protein